jgi:hypothetical protein
MRGLGMDDLDTPNCPKCLVCMEPVGKGLSKAGTLGAIVWECPECGLMRL